MVNIVCLDGATIFPSDDTGWKSLSEFGDVLICDRTDHNAGRIIELCEGADIVLTNKVPITAKIIAALPLLKYIGVLATGYNVVDVEAAKAAGIVVTNIPSYSTDSVAQTVFSQLLAITNRVESYAAANRAGRWSAAPDFSYRMFDWSELSGKIFGIVGFGNIGRSVAAIATAFGMKVAVVTSKEQSELPDGYMKMSVDELFECSDVISFHCPLTPDTRHLANKRRISTMKPNAILINTSRGPVVDEVALADALGSNRIAAAGLDVMAQEPPKADNPLLSLPNCFITPHIAWASEEARGRLLKIACDNIGAFLAGKPQNVVNP